MMMRAVFPNEDTVFGAVLLAFSPRASTVRMRPFVFGALTPVTVTVVSRVTKGRATGVMMMLGQFIDGGAVEWRRCISRKCHRFQPSIVGVVGVIGVIQTSENGTTSVVGVVGVIFAPRKGCVSVIWVVRVIRASEDGIASETGVHQILGLQFA